MGKIAKMQKKMAKQWMQGIAEGKDPVSDMERQAGQKADEAIAAQGIAGQAQLLNQSAMSQAGGAPMMAGLQAGQAQDLAQAQQDATLKRQTEGQRMMAALKEKRMAQGLAFGQNVRAQNQAAAATAVDAVLGAGAVGAEWGKLAMGGGGGGG